MNIYKRTVLCMFMAVCLFFHVHAQGTITQLEYWLDYKWETRQSIPAANQIEVDISSMSPGIHILGYRAGCSNGMWSSANYKHFLIPNSPRSDTKDTIIHYEYWLDYQWSERKNVAIANQLEIDIEGMSPGIHILGYRAATKSGKWSAAVYQHFIIPRKTEMPEEIVAYEYWFNNEPRQRVEISPQSLFSAEELVIPLDGISLSSIPDSYRFDVEQQKVFCPEEVAFSLQLFNRKGHGSSAIVSETFETEIAVDPNFIKIEHQKELQTSPLTLSSIQGIIVECKVGDQLTWSVEGVVPMFDIFNAFGEKVETSSITRNVTSEQEEQTTIFSLTASSTAYYILLHGDSWISSRKIRFENFSQATKISKVYSTPSNPKTYSIDGLPNQKPKKGLIIISVDGKPYRKALIK